MKPVVDVRYLLWAITISHIDICSSRMRKILDLILIYYTDLIHQTHFNMTLRFRSLYGDNLAGHSTR